MGSLSPRRFGVRAVGPHGHTTPIGDGGDIDPGAVIPATKEFWVILASRDAATRVYDTEIGANLTWPVAVITNMQSVSVPFRVPPDFTSLTDLVIVLIPDATETIQYDLFLTAGAVGEDFETIANSLLNEMQAVTLERITELDVSGVFTGVAALDYVGLRLESDTSDIRAVGLRMRYT